MFIFEIYCVVSPSIATSSEGNMEYDVFISYSRKDYVDENRQVIPGNVISLIKELFDANGISYWFDEDGVFSGDAFAPVIARNIKASKIFLFISSENSNASEWTSNEIATAHAYKKKIIPFRYDDSVYNDSVIIYIARLDYVEYQENKTKALLRLLASVQSYLNEERERKEKERQEEERRRNAEVSRQERAAKLQNLRERIESLENRKFDIEKEILTQEKTLSDLRNEKRILEANITDLQDEEAALLGHSRTKTVVNEMPVRKKETLKSKVPRKCLFSSEWADLKDAMAKKHWIVNSLFCAAGVAAVVMASFFSLISMGCWRDNMLLTAFCALALSAFSCLLATYRVLKNKRDGLFWIIMSVASAVVIYCTAGDYCAPLYNWTDDVGIAILIIISALLIFALISLFIRKNGQAAFSVLHKRTGSFWSDKLCLAYCIISALMVVMVIANWVELYW